MQLTPLKNFNMKTCFIQFIWFFRLKCWLEGRIISRIYLSLPNNAYKLMCFDRNVNGNRDVQFFEWDYWSLHWRKTLTLTCWIFVWLLSGSCLGFLCNSLRVRREFVQIVKCCFLTNYKKLGKILYTHER
jgi:hypothetical protein